MNLGSQIGECGPELGVSALCHANPHTPLPAAIHLLGSGVDYNSGRPYNASNRAAEPTRGGIGATLAIWETGEEAAI